MEKKSLVFAVNAERFEVSSVDPSTTLLEFLRTKTRYRGPKLGCGEGGCGACVVLLSKYHPITKEVEDHSVSSCLTLLCSVHLCSVTTTEGLGSSKNGFHSIHQRFAGFHASQCGFCTPGMCMSLFSALTNADKTNRPDPPAGFSKITVSEAEKAIAGNICRCTGYRPIVDACKSFASDVDIEDLGFNSFGGEDASVDTLPAYSRDSVNTFPDFLKTEVEACSSTFSFLQNPKNDDVKVGQCDASDAIQQNSSEGNFWYHPSSIDELQKLLRLRNVEEQKGVKMVVGNTCSGVYKDLDQYHHYIDLKGIPELSTIKRNSSGIEIGAAVTISRAIEVLKEEKEEQLPNDIVVFSKIAEHMSKVASHFVRNTASVGGNLIMAKKFQFASDIATILLAARSSVTVQVNSSRLVLKLEKFLEKFDLDSDFLLLSIQIPSSNNSVGNTKLLFETYRAAPRPLGNAVSYVNAAFLAEVENSENIVIKELHLVFGAYGTEHAIRATKVENYLVGKLITVSVLLKAIKLLKETILPAEGTTHPIYRSSLAVSFLFEFLRPLVIGKLDSLNVPQNHALEAQLCSESDPVFANGRPSSNLSGRSSNLLSAKQTIKINSDYLPVGIPTKKSGAELQASGEAVYVDDISAPKDCLYGAFVYSTKPMAHIKGIKFPSQEITSFISVKDIPSAGTNLGSATIFGQEPLFADSITGCAGQPLGIVIAETQKSANAAAAKALIEYSTENTDSPILTVDEAVDKSSFINVPPFFTPKKEIGDFAKGMESADFKILSEEVNFGSQYYFYMETQTALAVPDEDNCMVVYSSTQNPMLVQDVLAKCLGIPAHNVRVITRRVGGGFGGKAMKSIPIAVACAISAYKLGRPVRMYMDRKTDIITCGGRHPMKVTYSVGFKSDGKITALHVDLLINAGIFDDISIVMPTNITGALKKYDWGALSIDYKVCRTNLPSKSAMRAPGEVQGSFIAEVVIEHVASTLSLHSDSVRNVNIHSFESLQLFYEAAAGEPKDYSLPFVLKKLSNFESKFEQTRQFNNRNRWKKRGISRVPIIYPVTLMASPGKVGVLNDGSIVVEVGGIELGQGLWTKVKQMAAFSLGQLWTDGNQNLLERVRVVQADTLSLVQGGFTAGSTTSEMSCEAVRLACGVLIERLMPVKKTIEEQNGPVSWDALIMQANFQSVNLQASSLFTPDPSFLKYLNYGAAVSEVEIDVLTGAVEILQSDLVYDCGQSLNPAVDLGQIEGAFVQGIGFFMLEEHTTNGDGLVTSDGTWTYKVPTVDTIPKQFNVEILNSGKNQKRILSSKASGEPPLLMSASVHCATREAIRAARKELFSPPIMTFQLPVPATMPVVKELCGFDNVERFLTTLL